MRAREDKQHVPLLRLDLIERREDQQFLVRSVRQRVEQHAELLADDVEGLVLAGGLDARLDLGVDVAGGREVVLVAVTVEVPRLVREIVQHRAQRRKVEARLREVVRDELRRQAHHAVDHVRERGGEQQSRGPAGKLGGLVLLGHRAALVGYVVRHGVLELVVDVQNLAAHAVIVQVDVLKADGGSLVREPALPQVRRHGPHQADQTARLLQAGVVTEAGVEVTQARVEGIGVEQRHAGLLPVGGREAHLARLVDLVGVLRLKLADGGVVRH